MSVARLLHKLRTRPLVGGLALGETLKITTNVKRARKPVKGSLDEIDTPNFSSPKDLIEHLMTTVSIAVREHDKFAQIVEGIKTDPNVYERYRSMSKTAVTKAVSSEILKVMVSDQKELLEEGKKLKKDLTAVSSAVKILRAKEGRSKKDEEKLTKLDQTLAELRENVKEYNRESANLSKGIKKIGLDSDDPDHVKSIERRKVSDRASKLVTRERAKSDHAVKVADVRVANSTKNAKFSDELRKWSADVDKASSKLERSITDRYNEFSKDARGEFDEQYPNVYALAQSNPRDEGLVKKFIEDMKEFIEEKAKSPKKLRKIPEYVLLEQIFEKYHELAGNEPTEPTLEVEPEDLSESDDDDDDDDDDDSPAPAPVAPNPSPDAAEPAEGFMTPPPISVSDKPVEGGGLRYLKKPAVKKPRAKKVVMKL